MYHFYLPKYRTPDEVYELRRSTIERSTAYNVEWALKEFDKNPDVEFDFWAPSDVYDYLGMKVMDVSKSGPCGWFVIHGKKPDVYIQGMTLETFIEKQRKLLDSFIVNGEVEVVK